MSKQLPELPNMAQLKKQAKELLETIRTPRPEMSEEEKTVAAALALHDAQRILAREYGFPSWAKLKLRVETIETAHAAARLVVAAVRRDAATVRTLLAERPELARNSVSAAGVLADLEGLKVWVAKNPEFARARGGVCDTSGLGYVCLGGIGGDEATRVACAEFLLAHGADPNETWREGHGQEGRLPILYAAVGHHNYPRLAATLLRAGAKPNDGESVYHAAEKNHRECLAALLAAGADLGGVDAKWKNTPLYFLLGHAPDSGAAVVARGGIEWLLEHGANPNVSVRYEHAETPLHLAVRTGWPRDLIAALLKHGADPTLTRRDGATAYQLAIRYGRTDVANLLAQQGAAVVAPAVDHFLGACLLGDEAEARRQLAGDPSLVGALTLEQKRAVLEPAKRGQLAVLTLMGNLGLDLAVKGEGGETPLHHACWYGRTDTAIWLIRHGVPLDEPDRNFGAPPVGWCAHGSQFCRNPRGDYPAIMEALIQAGAPVPKDTKASPEVMAVLRRHGHAGKSA